MYTLLICRAEYIYTEYREHIYTCICGATRLIKCIYNYLRVVIALLDIPCFMQPYATPRCLFKMEVVS